MPKNNHKFQDNEKVLCFHGPLLYPAKIQKSQENKDNKESKDKNVSYFVHYLGWSKSWDEWVPEDRVLKMDESSLKKQKELNEVQNKGNKNKNPKKKITETKEPLTLSPPIVVTERPKVKLSSTPVLNTVPLINSEVKDNNIIAVKDIDGQKRKRIKTESNVETEDTIATKGPEIQIKIPELLKQALVEDWDQIRQKKLVRLPAKVPINRIVDDYLKLKLSPKLSVLKESIIREGVEGIKLYFNSIIGCQLLYPFERNQYKELIKESDDDSKTSAIYGAIHLLRLFVRLGSLMSYINMDESSTQLVCEQIQDFLKYLERTPSLFSANEFETSSADYQKKSN